MIYLAKLALMLPLGLFLLVGFLASLLLALLVAGIALLLQTLTAVIHYVSKP